MITTEKLSELCYRAYRAACDKGFHDEQKPDAVYKMLIITEIAEVVQADRKGLYAHKDKFLASLKPDDDNEMFSMLYEQYIKNSVEDEFADIIIRMLDYCGMKEIGFDDGIEYNDCTFNHFDFLNKSFPEVMLGFCKRAAASFFDMGFLLRIVFYYCESLDIDILWFVEMKMRYNETRERMHGRRH